VLDALAGDRGSLRVRTVNYGIWRERGAAAARRARLALEPGEPVSHPVLSERSVDRAGTTHLVGTLSTSHHWLVAEHRTTEGVAVLPGTGHLELYLAAAMLTDAGEAIGSVVLLEPLVVPDGVSVTVRVTVTPTDHDGRRWARIESDGGDGGWRVHSEAEVLADAGDLASMAGVPAKASGASDVDVLAHPTALMQFGPRWDAVVEAWTDGDEVVGRLALDDRYRDEVGAWSAHPALVDVATTFGIALGDQKDALHVPIGYDRVTRRGALPGTPWVRARRRGEPSNDVLRVDLALGDDDGNVLLAIEGLTLRPVVESASLGQPTQDVSSGPTTSHRLPPLLAVAEQHGIVAAEGVEMLERFLATDRARIVASSLELEDVMALAAPAVRPADDAQRSDPTADASTAGSVQATIHKIWVDLLGVPDIGFDEDFFDAGGHSLIAIRMLSRIHKELGVRFELTTMFETSTISTLAAQVLEARPGLDDELASTAARRPTEGAPPSSQSHRSLVPISTTGDKAPIFVVHGAGGNVLFLWTLARALGGSRPVYGFQAHGVIAGEMPDRSIEAMAERYVAELTASHADPYIIGGYSGGGIVAFEMTRQLQALGKRVDRLVLFDSPLPGESKISGLQELRWFSSNLRREGLAKLTPYVRWRFRRAVKAWLPDRYGRGAERDLEARQLGLTGEDAAGFVNLYHYFTAAAERYRPKPTAVDVVLLKAGWIWPVRPHDYHWSRHVRGPIAVKETPGDHWAMFFPENAPRLAEQLEALLDGSS
jgi:thioesterase domain-containing protein/acyl carrier protein